ncbi:adenylate kinase family enzyme [Microbacterium sp. W4I4]|uniref:AAA family ATPase n=1 Tax=Microbacterium sp. W4I4 TaxID=3042295 RepID=UPI00277E2D21|nr:AAA family ATPase [Microbacterium sp. W4I4]MDQ0612624.1 adenylate kinase family enzyme [Microbacterium sp. W4I4]
MLDAHDPLPLRPTRVLVAGVSGSGKTTFAARIADALGIPCYELDALHHGPGWVPRPEFLDDVRAFAATDTWVSEWQYTARGVNDLLPPRAQLVVWLDYPDRIVRARLWRRTLARSILRRELWNGNREPTLWKLATTTDPEENVLRWQAKTLHRWRERMPAHEIEFPHLTVVRLSHPRQAERWLATSLRQPDQPTNERSAD